MMCLLIFCTFLIVVSTKKCTLHDDIEYMYANCDPMTDTQKVFFYYPPNKECAPEREENDEGVITKEGSDVVPPYYEVKCSHICDEDGQMSYIKLYPYMEQKCKSCPKNEISINGGFIIDAKMDDEDHINQMLQKHFTFNCFREFVDNSTQDGCETWRSTGQSLKTPQFTH